ncbi:MAG: alpha/beta fold hydrolase [Burkholderiaceae bacterium]|nr:alpha/beta fold hydrolase [Burkholderiaceae bacterium]
MTKTPFKALARAAQLALLALGLQGAQAAGTVGTTLPADFPVIEDASLAKPVIGFGAAGTVTRTPVIFLHGNNDTPFPTACSNYGNARAFAQYLADNGYSTSELWGLGYQGDQCNLAADQTNRSRIAHTNQANVPDLRRFVAAVLAYTGARKVDIVAHSLGVTLAREWMRQDDAHDQVRRLVAVDGPNHGIINCSPSPANYFQLPGQGGFTPSSEVCQELGSPDTPFLKRLNGHHGQREAEGPTRVLVIRNTDASFVYMPVQDGIIPPVPAMDSYGQATDFSRSASLRGAREIGLSGQGAYDPILRTGHIGIFNSPQTWAATLEFLSGRR